MGRLVKVWILVILIMAVIIHHAATHAGAFYDSPNLFSHEAIVTFLLGMAISLIIWGEGEMRKKDRRGRRRQKVFGAIILVVGITLVAITILQLTGVFPEATVTLGTLLPEQLEGLKVYITPATLTIAGVGFSFIGSALLMGLCGLCVCCVKSGFSNPELDYYLAPIRGYRNTILRKSSVGRVFIWLYYYIISPIVILFIWAIPFKSWKRRLGLWAIPKLSRWCRRRVKNDGG